MFSSVAPTRCWDSISSQTTTTSFHILFNFFFALHRTVWAANIVVEHRMLSSEETQIRKKKKKTPILNSVQPFSSWFVPYTGIHGDISVHRTAPNTSKQNPFTLHFTSHVWYTLQLSCTVRLRWFNVTVRATIVFAVWVTQRSFHRGARDRQFRGKNLKQY